MKLGDMQLRYVVVLCFGTFFATTNSSVVRESMNSPSASGPGPDEPLNTRKEKPYEDFGLRIAQIGIKERLTRKSHDRYAGVNIGIDKVGESVTTNKSSPRFYWNLFYSAPEAASTSEKYSEVKPPESTIIHIHEDENPEKGTSNTTLVEKDTSENLDNQNSQEKEDKIQMEANAGLNIKVGEPGTEIRIVRDGDKTPEHENLKIEICNSAETAETGNPGSVVNKDNENIDETVANVEAASLEDNSSGNAPVTAANAEVEANKGTAVINEKIEEKVENQSLCQLNTPEGEEPICTMSADTLEENSKINQTCTSTNTSIISNQGIFDKLDEKRCYDFCPNLTGDFDCLYVNGATLSGAIGVDYECKMVYKGTKKGYFKEEGCESFCENLMKTEPLKKYKYTCEKRNEVCSGWFTTKPCNFYCILTAVDIISNCSNEG